MTLATSSDQRNGESRNGWLVKWLAYEMLNGLRNIQWLVRETFNGCLGSNSLTAIAAAVLLSASVQSSSSAQRAPSTWLVIYGVDPVSGTAVDLAAAEIYVDVWGHGETYQLKPVGNAVRIPLDPGWQCTVDPGWCDGRFRFDARITIRGEGYEAVASDHFRWLTTARDKLQIQFPGGRTVRIVTGATQVVTIPLRRPIARRLRLVDAAGTPVTDATITIRGLLARTNHCAFPEGEQLFHGPPAADGTVPLPQGQREFSIGVRKPHHRFHPKPRHGWIDGRFDAPETTITIEPMEKRRLELELRHADGRPALAQVVGNWAEGCMYSSVPIGETDQRGRLTTEEFYPEEFSDVGVESAAARLWLFDPRKEKWSGRRVFYLKP